MKRFFSLIVFIICVFLFVACDKATTYEIKNSDLSGKGTLSDPYKLSLEVEDNTRISFSVTDDKELSFELGNKENGQFVNSDSDGVIEVLKDASTNEFQINSLDMGESVLRFFIDESEVFVEVTVTEGEEVVVDFTKNLKVLAIGNSFSDDAMEYFYDIAEDYGVENIVLGNLYVGGASLQLHFSNSQANSKSYEYRKNVDGTWVTTNDSTLIDGITDEDWDIITLQQRSGISGMDTSYDPYLDLLVSYVNQHKTNENAKLVWHMTWAYQQNSDHAEFVNYNRNQISMYTEITRVVKEIVLSNQEINIVIPAGTAIQNLRTSFYGDTLTRDGYHLSYTAGRYIAGLTYFAAITGLSIDDIEFTPSDMSEYSVGAIKEAVNNSIEKPYEVTNSTFTEVQTRDDSFGSHAQLNYGSASNIQWNDELEAWVLAKTPGLESAAHYHLDTPTMGSSYEFSADILLENPTNNAGEFVIELLDANNNAIRIVLRHENSKYVVFTDMRRQTSFSGYVKLSEFTTYDDYVNIKIVNTDDQYKFYLNETLVYDNLIDIGDTHVILGTVQTGALVKNIYSEVYSN